MYKQFDIVAVKFPFSNDAEKFKVRLAIIISNNFSNTIDNDFLLCPITTQAREEVFSYLLEDKTVLSLPRKSEIRCNKIATIKLSLIIKKVSSLKTEHHKEVIELILKAINLS